MDRVPFGIHRLDSLIDGGAPAGSVVLLAGEPGAGAREFMHTAAVMNALARDDSDQFDLYYGSLHEDAVLPASVHYVSFTAGESQLRRELSLAMDESLVEEAIDGIEFTDLSRWYFQLSPVPREWYADHANGIHDLGSDRERRDVFEALGEFLHEQAEGTLVCIDSVTDLLGSTGEELSLGDVAMVLKGVQRASSDWGGLILLLLNRTTLRREELGHLVDASDGTLVFEWERGGNELDRTMVVTKFRGVLSRLEEDDIVRFETELTDAGFDISDVRKIR